jgi:hypothetical protein
VSEGRYRIEERLGGGGMGAVFRAVDLHTGLEVALKRMLPRDETQRARHAELRFRREFHTLSSLRHPRIVRAHDYGIDAKGPYYTMELLGGEDLRDAIRRRGTLPPAQVCAILRDLASALASLHARGLIHRDLTPRNVRIVGGRAVLFDFGVMVHAGSIADRSGTLSFVPPEVARGMPIDGRADLYSLGVLAYVMLTGMRPFEARDLADLPRAWSAPPVPPSTLAPGMPEDLEDLVLDLLCLEPLGRPPSAAVLIDRLTSIGALPPDPELAVDPGYVGSAAMVGREEELRVLLDLAREAAKGAARAFYIEAESGAGKTRLLTELATRAKLERMLALRVACEEHDGTPFAALSALIAEAFDAAPEIASAAAAPDAALLGRSFPAVRRRFRVAPERDDGDPADLRMRAQAAVERFVRALAARRPLVLLVDDLQRCDEASAAAIAGLARAGIARLLVGTAVRALEAPRATAAVLALSRVTPRLRLEGLSQDGVEALLRSIFGDGASLSRLARWMVEATGGSPLHCTELARHLIETGEARYADGTWILPEVALDRRAPEGLAAAMRRRTGELGEAARRIGEVLAVAGGEIDLERAIALADEPSIRGDTSDLPIAVFAALGALTHAGVLIDRGDRFRFRHDSLREALLAGIDAERRRALHLHVGSVLLAAGLDGDPRAEAEAGWHLQWGGDEARGGAMLERAGRRLYEGHALADCIAPLEAALDWRGRRRAPAAVRAQLASMLVAAGWVSSREVGWRHAHTAIELSADLGGMRDALRWGRVVGWHAGLALGIAWAWVRWAARRGEARGPTPTRMLSHFGHDVAFATAIAYAENRKDEVRAMAERIEPFRALRGHAPYALQLTLEAMREILDGRLEIAISLLEEARRLSTRARMNPTMSPAERLQAEAATRAMKALARVNQLDPELDAELEAIDATGLAYYRLTAQTARIVRHRYRGEERLARELEAATEATSLQLGSWSTDLQRLILATPAYALCHDVEGLKRCVDALERRLAEGMEFELHVRVARAELDRERGDHEAVRAALEPLDGTLDPDDHTFRQLVPACLAQSALEAYRHDDAERWARRALEAGDVPGARLMMVWLRCERILGLAEDALGRGQDAAARLDEAIVSAEARAWSSLAGQLHEARARVALAAGDRSRFETHLAACDAWLRPTENPNLIAIAERLGELGRGDARGQEVDVHRKRPGASTSESRARRSTTSGSLPRVSGSPTRVDASPTRVGGSTPPGGAPREVPARVTDSGEVARDEIALDDPTIDGSVDDAPDEATRDEVSATRR